MMAESERNTADIEGLISDLASRDGACVFLPASPSWTLAKGP
jgi:hypothetical protein